MSKLQISRRGFLGSGLASGIALAGATTAAATQGAGPGFDFEINRSNADWKSRLTEAEFRILRRGGTEPPKSSPLWSETRNGSYACKGCDLHTFDATWKIVLDKGWAFFRHSVPNAVLTGIDGPVPPYGSDISKGPSAMLEVHCRRCGSHLGHIVQAEELLLHCINGASLTFTLSDA